MTTSTLTLSEFLLARIAEDEAEARLAMNVTGDDLSEHQVGDWWEKATHGRIYAGHWLRVVDAGGPAGDREFANTNALPHIARHDPARVLAECKAKRAIVEAADRGDLGPLVEQEMTLLALASVYADHPDYRSEWAS